MKKKKWILNILKRCSRRQGMPQKLRTELSKQLQMGSGAGGGVRGGEHKHNNDQTYQQYH